MLQDLILRQLLESRTLVSNIRSSNDISEKGRYALDATEKNPDIEDTLAEQIVELQNQTTVLKNSVTNIIALPNGASTGDGQIEDAKIGIEGETYDTLGNAIREQIKTYKDVSVSNKEPTGKPKVWINTSANDSSDEDILIPQIDDTTTSRDDTWSSKKINDAIQAAVDELKSELIKYIDGK